MSEQTGGDHIEIGNIERSQGVAIGRGAHAYIQGNLVEGARPEIDVVALQAALQQLYVALGNADIAMPAKIAAQTATGNALSEGVQDGAVNVDPLVGHLKKVGETMTQAKVVVEQGSSLWASIQQVAANIAPLVEGGAMVAAAWLGAR